MTSSVRCTAEPVPSIVPETIALATSTGLAFDRHEHDGDILINLHLCVLEQCRALLTYFRPSNLVLSQSADQCVRSDEVAEGSSTVTPRLDHGKVKQGKEHLPYPKHDRSGPEIGDILARLYLWGDVVSSGRAQATSTLSPDLHRTIMEVLVECAMDVRRLVGTCSARIEGSGIPLSVSKTSKLDGWLEKASYILDNEEVVEQSDSEADSEESDQGSSSYVAVTQDILESLDESVNLLMSLLPGIDHLNSLRHQLQPGGELGIVSGQSATDLLEVSDPAKLWVSQVCDKYPDAPLVLAERLGEANWQRFCRLRIPQSVTFAEELGQARSVFHAPGQPASEFRDSAIGSSLANRPDDSKSNASYNSFASSANVPDDLQNRVPLEPPEIALGKPFPCSICFQVIGHVRNRADWKSVFLTLNVCFLLT